MWIKLQCLALCEIYQAEHLVEGEHPPPPPPHPPSEQYKSGKYTKDSFSRSKENTRLIFLSFFFFYFLIFMPILQVVVFTLMTYETEQVQYAHKKKTDN